MFAAQAEANPFQGAAESGCPPAHCSSGIFIPHTWPQPSLCAVNKARGKQGPGDLLLFSTTGHAGCLSPGVMGISGVL